MAFSGGLADHPGMITTVVRMALEASLLSGVASAITLQEPAPPGRSPWGLEPVELSVVQDEPEDAPASLVPS